ncbi:MAG TPA: tetratricopeptide repeat protein [Burkholderiales bacterium]|nr:tetratricopeptide repeat protein [Burkholderiales bacterium]
MLADPHGNLVSGANPRALEAYARALEAFVSWSGDAREEAARALEAAPEFTMGHVLHALLHVAGRDITAVPAGVQSYQRARALAQNEREHAYLDAIGTGLAGDFDGMRRGLGTVAARYPRDLLALAMAHSLDYLLGDTRAQRDRIAAALPQWSAADVGYHGVLAMHAFGLEECGEYARAEAQAFAALELDPYNLRAHHARAHVLEMQGRAAAGLRWMQDRVGYWDRAGASGSHVWWHLALHHLELGDAAEALAIYDRRLLAGAPGVSELTDASALLWRLHLRGHDLRARWSRLAELWTPRAADAYCAFTDLHAMLAFVGAARPDLQRRMLRAERARVLTGGTNAGMLRTVGLPAVEALEAYGRKDYRRAAARLRWLPEMSHRLGGSHAQRGLLGLTLRDAQKRADERSRRILLGVALPQLRAA